MKTTILFSASALIILILLLTSCFQKSTSINDAEIREHMYDVTVDLEYDEGTGRNNIRDYKLVYYMHADTTLAFYLRFNMLKSKLYAVPGELGDDYSIEVIDSGDTKLVKIHLEFDQNEMKQEVTSASNYIYLENVDSTAWNNKNFEIEVRFGAQVLATGKVKYTKAQDESVKFDY